MHHDYPVVDDGERAVERGRIVANDRPSDRTKDEASGDGGVLAGPRNAKDANVFRDELRVRCADEVE
jgi:hypothetical protein